jgi:quercetin dioxygenase-like cupin family protein
MKKILLSLFAALFCSSAMALSGTNDSTPTTVQMSNITSTGQVNESTYIFTLVNLTKFGENHPIDPKTGFNISLVALGKNASIHLVQADPGSILKMHYHKYRDEIAYIIKGEAILTVSDKNYTSKAGDLMYIPAMTLHRIVIVGNETVQTVSAFAPPFDGKDRIYVEP